MIKDIIIHLVGERAERNLSAILDALSRSRGGVCQPKTGMYQTPDATNMH